MWGSNNSTESVTRIHILVILLLGIVIYANSMNVPFTFDDKPNIVNNPAIKSYSLLLNAAQAQSDLLEPHLKPQMVSRIVGYATFALNYRLHGLSVFGYHLVNIIVHLANALLVYCLVNLIFSRETETSSAKFNDKNSRNFIALFSALLFVSHPVNTQAVTYIVQRFTSLATFFYLLSILGYIKSRLNNKKGILFVISILSAVLAMKTKEFSFTLPFVLVLIEFMFFRDKISTRAVNLFPFALSALIIPVSLIVTSMVAGNTLNASSIEFGSSTDITRWEYFLTQLTVIVFYLKLLLPPVIQNLDYDYPVFHSLFTPKVFLSALLLGFLMTVGIYLSRVAIKDVWYAKYIRLISFGILWFFITISAESSIIRIKDLIFEHRLYLPAIGLFIAAISLLVMLRQTLIIKDMPLHRIIVPSTLIIIFLFSFSTFSRNLDWQDEIRLWKDTVAKSPNKPRARNNLALAYYDSGFFDEALKENKVSLTLKSDPGIHVNIGNIYLKQNLIEAGIKEFGEAIAIKSDSEKAYNGLCKSNYLLKRFPEALKACGTAVRLKPDYAEAYNLMGMIYFDQSELEAALKMFNFAISLKPDFAVAHNNAGNVYYGMKSYDAALKEYQIVSSLDPKYIGIHLSIGKIYHDIGRFSDAVNEYQKLLLVKPNVPEALHLIEKSKSAINYNKVK